MLKFFCINWSLGSTASFFLIKHFWLDPHNAEQTLCQRVERGAEMILKLNVYQTMTMFLWTCKSGQFRRALCMIVHNTL